MLARVLDVLVFEIGMNLADGFDTAFSSTFAALLNKVDFSKVHNNDTLLQALKIEGLLLTNDLSKEICENIKQLTDKPFD